MDYKDLIITPIVLVLLYLLAWVLRPFFTDSKNQKYFLPALTVKFVGAIAVGLIYQYYYGGGDTFNFHTHGSVHIWEAFMNDIGDGLILLMDNGKDQYSVFEYSSKIWYYGDSASYSVVKLAAVFDLFTFATYSATACFFAFISFSGVWVLYLTFYRLYPELHRNLAFVILFLPSVFFWGSGIFKDTLVLAALGWLVYSFYKIAIDKRKIAIYITVFLISAYIIYSIKIYVLMTIFPALLVWLVFIGLKGIKIALLRIVMLPVFIIIAGVGSYLTATTITEGHYRYSFENIAETARITSHDIRYGWGARFGEGSGYTLGELDGTFESMISLAPAAINVALFRPYLWEVQNPLMLMSALESLAIGLFTLYILFRIIRWGRLLKIMRPEVLFCLSFSLVFAFAVGISTFNFGTLARYKLPLLPFYLAALVIISYLSKRERKLA